MSNLRGMCQRGDGTCFLGTPETETCDGLDNDCDGDADEDELGSALAKAGDTGPMEQRESVSAPEGFRHVVTGFMEPVMVRYCRVLKFETVWITTVKQKLIIISPFRRRTTSSGYLKSIRKERGSPCR